MKKTIVLVTGLALALCTAPVLAKVSTGAPAPDFTLTDTNGQEHSLSDFKGKFVVLEWTNYQCPFVVKHYSQGHMQKLQKKYTGKDVVWLTVCSSAPGKQGYVTPQQANAMMREQEWSSTAMLLDPQGDVGQLYGAKTTPHMYVINPQGTLLYQGAIDSIRSANPTDIEKADNYVKMALGAAMKGEAVAVSDTRPYGCSVKYASK